MGLLRVADGPLGARTTLSTSPYLDRQAQVRDGGKQSRAMPRDQTGLSGRLDWFHTPPTHARKKRMACYLLAMRGRV